MAQQAVDVFVLASSTGSSEVITEPKSGVRLRLIPTGFASMAEFAQSPFASQFAEEESELVAVAPTADAWTLARIASWAMIMRVHNPKPPFWAASVVIDPIDSLLVQDPTSGGRRSGGLKALLAPRASHGAAVFQRSEIREIGSLRPVSEPVWDWLIRAALRGDEITYSVSSADIPFDANRLPLLAPPAPGKSANWLREHIAAYQPSDFDVRLPASVGKTALRAGLFQWHDFLDESHEQSQSIEGEGENQIGDYWHAIMHRREPDYSNAKYWFRQFKSQPSYLELRQVADGILAACTAPDASKWRNRLQADSRWNPLAFVDLCEECAADEQSDLAIAARRIQYAEMSLLV